MSNPPMSPAAATPQTFRLIVDNFPFDGPMLLPPNVTSLEISNCTISSGVDDLMRLLGLLPSLRELSLYGLKGTIPPESLVSQVFALEYLVTLPYLDDLFLSGELLAQADIFGLFNLSSQARIKFECVNDNNLEGYSDIGLERQIHKLSHRINRRFRHLEPKYNIAELVMHPTQNTFLVRISTQQAVNMLCILFSSHDPEGQALPFFVEHLHMLRSAICLSIRPYDFTSSGDVTLELWIERLRNTLWRLKNVEKLFVQDNINDIVWDVLRRPIDLHSAVFPKLRELAIIALDGTVSEMIGGLADPPLEECVGWRKETLRKITFSECPDLEDSDISRLSKALDGIAIELHKCRDYSDSDIDSEGPDSNHTDFGNRRMPIHWSRVSI
ncbi:hypothetical protein PENSPDRAFT_685188 [Peniophora sp. CONT]|nr:hypothetical protein PENSPDRAFT_685188 [Peniophora sp. CONT]